MSGIGRGANWLLGLDRNGHEQRAHLPGLGQQRTLSLAGPGRPDPAQSPPDRRKLHVLLRTNGARSGWAMRRSSPWTRSPVTTLSANYSVTLFRAREPHRLGDDGPSSECTGNSLGLTFTMPLENSRTLSASATSRSGINDFYVAASRTPGLDSTLGWRALAGTQDEKPHGEAGLYYMGSKGTLSGDVSTDVDQTAVRVGASGGVVAADGRASSRRAASTRASRSRRSTGYPDVGVGLGEHGPHEDRCRRRGAHPEPVALPEELRAPRSQGPAHQRRDRFDRAARRAHVAQRSAGEVPGTRRSRRAAEDRVRRRRARAGRGRRCSIEGDKEQFYVARRGEAFVTGLKEPRPRPARLAGHAAAVSMSTCRRSPATRFRAWVRCRARESRDEPAALRLAFAALARCGESRSPRRDHAARSRRPDGLPPTCRRPPRPTSRRRRSAVTCQRNAAGDGTTVELHHRVRTTGCTRPAQQNRAQLGATASRINYDLDYQNSTCSTLWSAAGANRISASITGLSGFTPTTTNVPFWGCVPGSQTGLTAGTYTDTVTMTLRWRRRSNPTATFPVTIVHARELHHQRRLPGRWRSRIARSRRPFPTRARRSGSPARTCCPTRWRWTRRRP